MRFCLIDLTENYISLNNGTHLQELVNYINDKPIFPLKILPAPVIDWYFMINSSTVPHSKKVFIVNDFNACYFQIPINQ